MGILAWSGLEYMLMDHIKSNHLELNPTRGETYCKEVCFFAFRRSLVSVGTDFRRHPLSDHFNISERFFIGIKICITLFYLTIPELTVLIKEK